MIDDIGTSNVSDDPSTSDPTQKVDASKVSDDNLIASCRIKEHLINGELFRQSTFNLGSHE